MKKLLGQSGFIFIGILTLGSMLFEHTEHRLKELRESLRRTQSFAKKGDSFQDKVYQEQIFRTSFPRILKDLKKRDLKRPLRFFVFKPSLGTFRA